MALGKQKDLYGAISEKSPWGGIWLLPEWADLLPLGLYRHCIILPPQPPSEDGVVVPSLQTQTL
jgi:hypothetical protein